MRTLGRDVLGVALAALLLYACGGSATGTSVATPKDVSPEHSVRLGSCECPLAVRERGNRLWKEGQFEKALTEFLTCPRDHLPNLMGLAVDYPPARDAVRRLRDTEARRVHPPRVDDAVAYVDQLNFSLDDHEGAVALFERWRPYSSRDRRTLHRLVWYQLVKAKRYEYALTFEDLIVDNLARSAAFLREARADGYAEEVEGAYTGTASAYSAALIGVGRWEDGLKVIGEWPGATGHGPGSEAFCRMVEVTGMLLDDERRVELLEAVETRVHSCGQ